MSERLLLGSCLSCCLILGWSRGWGFLFFGGLLQFSLALGGLRRGLDSGLLFQHVDVMVVLGIFGLLLGQTGRRIGLGLGNLLPGQLPVPRALEGVISLHS